MSLAEKISEAELAVMKILWRRAGSVPFSDIRVELHNTMGWEKSTVATLLRRLQDKGAVSAQEQRVRYYTANITRKEYAQAEEQSMIDKLYDGSAKSLVAALCSRGKLTEADIDELKEFFQMGGKNK
jgi:BlaI family penicillinase repressor